MTDYRGAMYARIFATAALYNLAFGVWAGFWPLSFFSMFDLAPPRYPGIWQCLGMVVGVYSLLYGYASRHLDRAVPIIVVGLLGKVLGPLGLVSTIRSGEWPIRTVTLIVFNDIVWWLPFSLFLLEGRRIGDRVRACAPYACAALNALALVTMIVAARPGTEITPDPHARMQYIAGHPGLWRGGWAMWMAAAISLIAFYAWWGASVSREWAIPAVFVAAAGMCCDLFAESLYVAWLPDYPTLQPLATFLTGAVANGLYTLAGIILTMRSRLLTKTLAAWAWGIWVAGIALTTATLVGSLGGIAVSTGVLFMLFCPWTIAVGRHLR